MATTPDQPLTETSELEPLRLVSILVSGLPVELGTPDEPATYTVPAVFSRQVTASERARIEDPDTARRLSQPGRPVLALTVSDRRLLIQNTTLAQLRDGLATALAAMLREVDRDLEVLRAVESAQAEAADADERARFAAVAAAAAAVHFE